MRGINSRSGKAVERAERLRQSIGDILQTPRESRLRRPGYGSRLYQLVDAPMTPATVFDWCAEASQAVSMWEPEYKVRSVKLVSAAPGRMVFNFSGEDAGGDIIDITGVAFTW